VPIVSNSSPLIALARIQRLDLVAAVLQSMLIPPAVAREIKPSIPDLPAWVSVKVPSSQQSTLSSRGRLGDGEREAIALAIEIGADGVPIDDRAGRRVAKPTFLKEIADLDCARANCPASRIQDFPVPRRWPRQRPSDL